MDFGNDHARCALRLVVSSLLIGSLVLLADAVAAPPAPAAGPAMLAQLRIRGRAGRNASPEADVFPHPERSLLRQLSNAKELIKQRRHGEAVRCLDVILQSSEDYLYRPDEAKPLYRSLRSEANRIVGRMPRQGRELYELQYGSEARHLLDKATLARDPGLLAEVSRRFFHTAAGYEATFLLGLHHLDHREPLIAALKLQQLRDEASSAGRFEPALSVSLAICWYQAEFPDQAEAALRALHERRPTLAISIAGRDHSLSSDPATLLPWLIEKIDSAWFEPSSKRSQWTQPRGNASRNATVVASRPLLEPVWRIPTSDHPVAGSFVASQSQYHAEQNVPMLSSLHPLVLDDVVLMRCLQTLVAIDFRTGKRLWEVPVDDVLEKAPDAYRSLFPRPGQLVGLLCQRVWKDSVYGALSSDGQRVFAIEDLGISLRGYGRRFIVQGGRHVENPVWPKSYNRLAAYDIHTGKLLWHVGSSSDQFDLELSGAFFLGSPLPMAGRLYQLAEVSGEIRLVVLEASTGKVRWSQRIALAEQSILQSPLRRLTAISPSSHNGVVVCPTAGGAIVAVDPAMQSLIWGYRYARSVSSRSSHMWFRPFPTNVNVPTRWVDGNVILLEDRVLAAPPDSDEIHCLSLLDGSLLWKKRRQDDLYVAAADDNTVVLVGAKRVRALSLEGGEPAWGGRTLALPEGSSPSGQGFHSGKRYYLPLNSAEVLVLDLEAGKIHQKLVSPSETVPGNLVCYQDKVISQSVHGLDAFHQLDALGDQIARKLAKNADDPEALRLKGQVLLDAGQRDEAIDCLRRSYRSAPQRKCRVQLRRALLDGLRQEFAQYRSAEREIKGLLDTPAQNVEYLRLMAVGLEAASAPKAALEYYMRLADRCADVRELISVDKSHSVRQDRWLCARLSEFRESASAEVLEDFDRRLRQRLDAALQDEGIEPLVRFVNCLGTQPQADEARRELVRRYLASGQLLRAEVVLRRQVRSSEPAKAAATVLQLAHILEKAGRWKDVAACYREIEEKWGDVVCHDGKTGRQLVASLPADSPVVAHLHPERRWPVGAVEARITELDPSRRAHTSRVPIGFCGDRRPFFAHSQGAVDQGRQELSLSDGCGREEWKLRIASRNQPYLYSHRNISRLSVRGHLMLLSLGYRSVAIDTLADDGPRILWDQTMTNLIEPALTVGGPAVHLFNAQWAQPMFLHGLSHSRYAHSLYAPDAFTEDYVCHHSLRRCVALDPLSGKTLWSRRHLPPRCLVFGDHQRVFLVPENQTKATVLRASDGHRLSGTRTVPRQHEWIATLGCNILRWRAAFASRRLELFDPWEQKVLWGPHSFSGGAKLYLVDGAIGVMEPGGRFVVFALPDGRKRVDVKLDPEPQLQEIVLFDWGSGYTLVTSARLRSPRRNQASWNPLHGVVSRMIRKGRVYAFDSSGSRLWPDYPKGVEVENQQLVLTQPAWLPVLTFASQRYDRRGPRNVQCVTSVLMIDKRNGQKVVDKNYRAQTIPFRLTGDPEAKTVEFAMQKQNLKLTFTDRPVGPREKAKPQTAGGKPRDDGKNSKTLDAILKAMKKAAGG